MEKQKTQKTPEEVRADARDRKRAQRERDYVARDQSRLASMDLAQANVERIMAAIAAEDKSRYGPGVPIPNGPAWWIGKSTKEILARLSTNPNFVEPFPKNRQPIKPVEATDGQV